jgi:hypothetical protein
MLRRRGVPVPKYFINNSLPTIRDQLISIAEKKSGGNILNLRITITENKNVLWYETPDKSTHIVSLPLLPLQKIKK